ncbi:MAG: aminotransferase class I/II-fold pyridoxal phosphate-dependent enzyme [Gammaproteobacteria bacterium]|nr:aminotransferase class I/II-fold pyridoxal phosphate-dependent enzyme [Gammaproteobacteria bacterium]
MSLFDKFQGIASVRRDLDELGIVPFGVVTERLLSATEGIVNGRRTILAGTNNYLGLTFHPECIETARAAVLEEGTGTTGSRMANGTYAGHEALEQELADFFGCGQAIVFSTGYQANLGMIATLAGPGDVVVLDADCHASIYDACRLGGCDVIRFRHNDAQDLEKRLRRLGERAQNALIVVEGLYSMQGDQAPLREIAAVKRRRGGYLLVDEAHSLGMLGANGRGAAEAAGVEQEVDFIVGTFSKSLGAIGGYCVSHRPELELVRYAIRPYIFTASPSPSVIASVRVALRVMRAHPELRERLWENAHRLYHGFRELGYDTGPEPSPVLALAMPGREQALRMWNALLENGVYVNLVLPPATPSHYPLLRCSVSAAHTPEQVERILGTFAALRRRASAVHDGPLSAEANAVSGGAG